MSVTAHGASMAYVLTTFFIMGFGYFVAETALRRAAARRALGLAGIRARRGRDSDGRRHCDSPAAPRCSTPSTRRC